LSYICFPSINELGTSLQPRETSNLKKQYKDHESTQKEEDYKNDKNRNLYEKDLTSSKKSSLFAKVPEGPQHTGENHRTNTCMERKVQTWSKSKKSMTLKSENKMKQYN
jgi:hypothetical protein